MTAQEYTANLSSQRANAFTHKPDLRRFHFLSSADGWSSEPQPKILYHIPRLKHLIHGENPNLLLSSEDIIDRAVAQLLSR